MSSNVSSFDRLHILHWNINGLKSHLPTLTLALAECRCDVIILLETLLKSNFSLHHYNEFHNFNLCQNRHPNQTHQPSY